MAAKTEKIDLGTYEVSKVEEKETKTEEGTKWSWKYTLTKSEYDSPEDEVSVVITAKSEIVGLNIRTKGLQRGSKPPRAPAPEE